MATALPVTPEEFAEALDQMTKAKTDFDAERITVRHELKDLDDKTQLQVQALMAEIPALRGELRDARDKLTKSVSDAQATADHAVKDVKFFLPEESMQIDHLAGRMVFDFQETPDAWVLIPTMFDGDHIVRPHIKQQDGAPIRHILTFKEAERDWVESVLLLEIMVVR